MSYLLSLCDKSSMVQTFLVIKTLFVVLCSIIPSIIIIVTIIDMYKAISNNAEEVLKENGKMLIKRLIAGLTVFLLPSIISFAFTNIVDGSVNEVASCMKVASAEKVAELREKEEKEAEEKRKEEREKVENVPEISESQKNGIKKSNNKVTNLKYIAQGNYSNLPFCANGKTVASSGCGAAAFAMIASSYSNSQYDMNYVASWFCNNKYSEANGALSYTAMISEDTLNHFGLSGGILFGNAVYSGPNYNEQNGNAILNAVKSGKSVIIGIPRHWVVAGPNESCNSNQVYLYDSGFPSRNGCYTPKELFNVTYNSRNHCTKEGICGWDIAIVLS